MRRARGRRGFLQGHLVREGGGAVAFLAPRRTSARWREGLRVGAVPSVLRGEALPSIGAVPLMKGGRVIGAIGCGGGTGEQDHECAVAGAEAAGAA